MTNMKSAPLRAAGILPAADPALEVNINADLASVDIMHLGRMVTIMRNQNPDNAINPEYAKTARKCPPFCIQPSELAPGVKTIAELEVLHLLKKISDGDASMLVIDSRTKAWVEKGVVPGTVNIPASAGLVPIRWVARVVSDRTCYEGVKIARVHKSLLQSERLGRCGLRRMGRALPSENQHLARRPLPL